MKYELERYTPEEWRDISVEVHRLIFSENRNPDLDRIDYAVIVGCDNEALGYVTCREFDSKTVYWQYGGVVPNFRGMPRAVGGFDELVRYARGQNYERIMTYVENVNVGYMKLLLSRGFLIIGTRLFKGGVFVEFVKEF